MSGLFIFLFLISLFAFVAGLIKPGLFSRFKIYGRKKVGVVFGTSTIVLMILVGVNAEPLPKNQEQKSETEPVVTEAVSTPVITPQVQTQQPVQRQTNTVLVTRVIDGDTIEIEGGQKVRYIGIDTPETVDPRKPVQCFGVEASNKNKELVSGKRVRLEKDVSETDKYGRLLRYVYVGDTFVNLELVKQGYAYASSFPPDVKYQSQFTEAQRQAKEQNRGLWGSCPVDGSLPATTTVTPQSGTPACDIKGNISQTTDEKIYHIPGCGSYNQTVINENDGERWFCTEQEAVSAGWRKAKNCP